MGVLEAKIGNIKCVYGTTLRKNSQVAASYLELGSSTGEILSPIHFFSMYEREQTKRSGT